MTSRAPFPVPLRVMYVIDDLGLGGAQRQLVELLKGLPRDGYDIQVISLSTTKVDYAKALQEAGIRLVQIPQAGKWDWRCFFTLLKTIRRTKPSIVHTWLFTADLYGRLVAWLAGVPVIISAVRSVEPDKPRHYVWVDRLLRRITHAFTVNARAIGEVLIAREGVDASKIFTVYNGLDLARFDPASMDGVVRRRIGVEDGVPLVGIVGRLAPVKDHATFLHAAAQVLLEVPRAQFLVVGSGLLHRKVHEIAHELGIEAHVHFLDGWADISEIFAALDLSVVSSEYEGCCNVILEAMAMGKPVVATAVGGNPELVIEGETGLLVPPKDPQRLAEAIVQVLHDPHHAKAMGYQARRLVEARFTLQRMVQETEQLYQQLLVRGRS